MGLQDISFVEYHRANSKKNTIRNYKYTMAELRVEFAEREVGSLTSDEIFAFLSKITQGAKQTTKRVRYSLLKAFSTLFATTWMPVFRIHATADKSGIPIGIVSEALIRQADLATIQRYLGKVTDLEAIR